MTSKLFLILLAVILNTAANLLIKQGSFNLHFSSFPSLNFFLQALRAFFTPYIFTGIVFYVLSLTVWLLVVSKNELSFAIPFMSLSYIFIAIASFTFWHENLTLLRIVGILVVIFGVYLVSRTA